jgi:formamidopyrimidine-DNA glycosylase
MREIFNPYAKVATVHKPEPTKEEKEVAVANAMSNINPSQCPKCGNQMGQAFLFDRRSVYYCDPCRVTHPTE